MLVTANYSGTVNTASAGIYAVVGAPLETNAQLAMTELGYQPRGHAAKQLEAHDVARADLVLTSTEIQRSGVVDLHIPANKYTFTLKEFANLVTFLADAPEETGDFLPQMPNELDARLKETLKWRGTAPLLTYLDIEDPYLQTQESFDLVAVQTEVALKQVVNWLP